MTKRNSGDTAWHKDTHANVLAHSLRLSACGGTNKGIFCQSYMTSQIAKKKKNYYKKLGCLSDQSPFVFLNNNMKL